MDYIEGLEAAVVAALKMAKAETHDTDIGKKNIGIGVDTTGSTPVAVNKDGMPLSLLPEFKDNPAGMFILWKDHTGVAEAEEINALSQKTENGRFTQYCGGTYSSEWFWSKILHTMRTADKRLVEAAHSWMEHCDWVPALLSNYADMRTTKIDISKVYRSRCAAGHKALWHNKDFNGLPFDFLAKVDHLLSRFRETLYKETYTSDVVAGALSPYWAEKLGLQEGIPIAVGAFDAHMGAVGNGIKPGMLSRIVGTSTCDMVVAPYESMLADGKERLIKGICGQVDGSIIPGMYGLEAGQSAVGDIFANFRDWFSSMIMEGMKWNTTESRKQLNDRIYDMLTARAAALKPEQVAKLPLIIDYHNGRRTPFADQRLSGAAIGIKLSTTEGEYFAALVAGTCYTARQIMETFTSQGIPLDEEIACGGIADKNPYVMQTMADVMGIPIRVAASGQTCALGAAMFGAVVGGPYHSVSKAQQHMSSGFKETYTPRPEFVKVHNQRYEQFCRLVPLLETELRTFK